jgi:hypothetical protein
MSLLNLNSTDSGVALAFLIGGTPTATKLPVPRTEAEGQDRLIIFCFCVPRTQANNSANKLIGFFKTYYRMYMIGHYYIPINVMTIYY